MQCQVNKKGKKFMEAMQEAAAVKTSANVINSFSFGRPSTKSEGSVPAGLFAANASDTTTTPATGVGGEGFAKKVVAELKEQRLLLERLVHATDELKNQNQKKYSSV